MVKQLKFCTWHFHSARNHNLGAKLGTRVICEFSASSHNMQYIYSIMVTKEQYLNEGKLPKLINNQCSEMALPGVFTTRSSSGFAKQCVQQLYYHFLIYYRNISIFVVRLNYVVILNVSCCCKLQRSSLEELRMVLKIEAVGDTTP